MLASIEDRKQLLAGLNDTDGTNHKGKLIGYSTASNALADGYVFVSRSLGLQVTLNDKASGYKKDGVYVPCSRSNYVTLLTKTAGFNSIVSVEPDGYEQATCIAIDNESKLFVTRGFKPTHNSDTVNRFPELLSKATGEVWDIVTVHLALVDAPDILGFLIPQKTDEGPVAAYTKPRLISQVEEKIKAGADRVIVFFDERAQADPLVQKAVAPILLDHRIGDFFFPEGTYFISASNRVADKAGVSKELTHLTNREIQLDFEIQITDYVTWGREHDMHEMLLGFCMFKPGAVIQDKVPAVPGPYCTPRSYAAAGKFLNGIMDDSGIIPVSEAVQEIVAGTIGRGASAELFAFLATKEHLPDWDDVLADPDTAKIPPASRLDAAYAASSMVIARATPETLEQAAKYTSRLNIEMQTMIIKQLVQSLGAGVALNSPTINKFISQHRSLILDSI